LQRRCKGFGLEGGFSVEDSPAAATGRTAYRTGSIASLESQG